MTIHNPVNKEKWKEFLARINAKKSSYFIPEYDDDNDRNLNNRYYR